jgi:glycolate oxidase iron-sulfur subunit
LNTRDLLRLADQCVKCGLCLPGCPTFRLRRNEADSPRGRIALIQGIATGLLQDSERTDAHLDGCLECRACELACPSLVQFGSLMDAAREARVRRLPWPRRLARRWRLDLLADSRLLPLGVGAAVAYRWSGLARVVRRSGLLRLPRVRVLHGLAERMRRPRDPELPVVVAGRARAVPEADRGQPVALFRGCVARALEPDVAAAAARVFAGLGISVSAPKGQVCCGAMHRHNGFPAEGDRLLERNRAVFDGKTAVVGASACAAELGGGLPAAELCRALVDIPWPEGLALRRLDGTVAVHEPCSHRNQLRDSAVVYRLLGRIPGLRVSALQGNETCCGAAGTYLLDQPETALRLAEDKIDALARMSPRWLATTNTGCAAHLAAAAAEAGLAVRVVHPVELLALAMGEGIGLVRDRSRTR